MPMKNLFELIIALPCLVPLLYRIDDTITKVFLLPTDIGTDEPCQTPLYVLAWFL